MKSRSRFCLRAAAGRCGLLVPQPLRRQPPTPTAPTASRPNARSRRADAPRRRRRNPRPGRRHDQGRGGSPDCRPGAPAAPRPYNRVITAEAKTRVGMFKVHRVGDRLLFEIPAKELNKDELVVGRLARAPAGNQTPGPAIRLRRVRRRSSSASARCAGSGTATGSFSARRRTRSRPTRGTSVYRSVQNSNYGPDHRRRSTSTRTGRTAPRSST